jgi:hypothetical protein
MNTRSFGLEISMVMLVFLIETPFGRGLRIFASGAQQRKA